MLPPFQLEQTITSTIREEWGRILASLVKSIGDIQLAEDSLQDAVESALTNWQQHGLPETPAAWLLQTARRKAIDRFRRDQRFARLQPQIAYLAELAAQPGEESDVIPDKRLEMMFTCCHPALEQKTRIALTLRTLGGLTTEEIANTFLDSPSAMAQRLVRAKKKIALAAIPYQVPEISALPERLSGVLSVIYFIFNQGYSPSSGEQFTRNDLADEAIRLARIMLQLIPDQTEVAGLLALMLLHDSRRSSRISNDNEFIPLEFQNRSIWDKNKIAEGVALLKNTLLKQQVGVYQLQAAISAIHAESSKWAATDWPQITALYELLYVMQPSPVVRLNQAMAVSFAISTERAIEILDEIATDPSMQNYQHYFHARADILLRAKDAVQARVCLEKAMELADNVAEKRFIENKLKKVGGCTPV